MGLLARLFGEKPAAEAATWQIAQPVHVLGGHTTLEVVGESYHQDHLWQQAGGHTPERVRCEIVAELVPEPDNPHDRNAVQVLIRGGCIGHLSRDDAAAYVGGVQRLRAEHGVSIGLRGVIVGGGQREGRLGMLGVFLEHEPADFGVSALQSTDIAELRTGLSQAIATDREDDSYDLSWLSLLSGQHVSADIPVLRQLLVDEKDPIDRHFMFAELERCLYKTRDVDVFALEAFDAACTAHDAEMTSIRGALYEKFGCIPVIETYRQAAIRSQKARDWARMHQWAERGLAVYGDDAARPEAVADLQKRAAYAVDKLNSPVPSRRSPNRQDQQPVRPSVQTTETLVCASCGRSFERLRTRGRKPSRCTDCRA